MDFQKCGGLAMDVSLYYQILDIGILYEKGRKNGKLWRFGERKRLKDEILFWQKILDYISTEKKGITCSKELFKNLEKLCKKYKFPNYERILLQKDELLKCNYKFKINKDEEAKINDFMKQLLSDMLKNLNDYKNKKSTYRLLSILHNLPKAMHGRNILCNYPHFLSYSDVLNNAKGYMNEKMQKEYEKYLL